MRSLDSCMPPADRSSRLFTAELNKARKVTSRNALLGVGVGSKPSLTDLSSASAEQQYNPLELLGISEEGSNVQKDDFVDDGALLDEQFKQVLTNV